MKATTDNFQKAIAKLVVDNHNNFADCFDVFLDIALYRFSNNATERQVQLFKLMQSDKDFANNVTDAICLLGELSENYHDALGDIFMEYVSHGQHGQFFTPDSVSMLMAQVSGVDKCKTVNDCACGSGRLLLNTLSHARVKGNDPLIYANDLSMTCVKMTLLNLVLNSAGGMVSCGDTLENKYSVYFHIDRLWNVGISKPHVFSTIWRYDNTNVDEVNKKRFDWWHQIAQYGWTKYVSIGKGTDEAQRDEKTAFPSEIEASANIDALTTNVSVDNNGQFTLNF